MKKEREIYLKPLTLREQVAMEQGICQASIIINEPKSASVSSTAQDFTEINAENDASDNTFQITWN